MKDIVWSKTLSIGVEEVDEDHRKLVDIFNTLNHAVKDREAAEYLAAVLDELINCTVWHFSHEERLMLKYQYKDMEAHKAEHRELIDTAKELQRELLQGGGEMTERHIETLERWLTEHILTTDMRLGAFLANVM
ncbi:MAG: bacteriohemerythrin [Rhodocyclaceae bacterium]|nr:bacteriohemerythrin [Rhodocyclaceae bacterium]